jgi:phage terminase small subunit
MTTSRPPRPPRGLGSAGRALWREVVRDYVLDPAEAAILLQMCRLSDELEAINDELSAQNACVPGSRGQATVNPLIVEARLTSLTLAKLAKTLSLPRPKSGRRRGALPSVVNMQRMA